ncbi:UNVERIFIED_CONTAM: F-box/FBD/LRR-repeat protein [Sesamum latifolium]|uniref:F-box/FBD/LRR-repeat protein n=1 Tax=Sesamum latifolium TaxID=2727402 RepID=A0AAW2VU40_9LAMI
METDLISSLPCDVIDNILKYLPLNDAVKTSILSREWRYKWETVPCVVLESTCKVNLVRKYDWVSIIDRIILLHKGSITKFSLTIADLEMCRGSDNWLHFLSNCHVEELTLRFGVRDSHPVISQFLFTVDQPHVSFSRSSSHLPHLEDLEGSLDFIFAMSALQLENSKVLSLNVPCLSI